MMTDAERREKLWDLVKDMKFAMFTTHHANGHLHSRPMTTQNKDMNDDSLWFFMRNSGEPTHDLQDDAQVNVSYADPGKDTYVSVSGVARNVQDEAKKRELWTSAADAWFPNGIEDPDVALVKVTISHADYWDVKANKLVQVYEMAKAAVTGNPPKDLGERGQVRMH